MHRFMESMCRRFTRKYLQNSIQTKQRNCSMFRNNLDIQTNKKCCAHEQKMIWKLRPKTEHFADFQIYIKLSFDLILK